MIGLMSVLADNDSHVMGGTIVGKFRECAGCHKQTYNRVIEQAESRVKVPEFLQDRSVVRVYRCVECNTEDLILQDSAVDLHILST